MCVERAMAAIFCMDKGTWERHSNPWSVYTRYLTLPLLCSIVWSRMWLGWWFLVPLAGGFVWLWANPRVFGPPKTSKWWASKGTFGERVWLNRKQIPIPKHHARMAGWLAFLAGLSKIPLLYGLIYFDLSTALWGLFAVNVFKSWFIDRMVWLYEEMKYHPQYAHWEY